MWFGAGLVMVWGSGGGQWDGEIRVTIRAELLSLGDCLGDPSLAVPTPRSADRESNPGSPRV